MLDGPAVPLRDGDRADIRFVAPTGTLISAITYQRWLQKGTDDDFQPTLQLADGAVLETCSIPMDAFTCEVGVAGTGANPEITFGGLATTSLSLGVGCRPTPPATQCQAGGGTVYHFIAVLYDASVTLNDPSPPTIGTISGSLLSAGWLRGIRALAIDASDASGISGWSAQADGALAASSTSSCDYTFVKPCPDLSAAPLSVNTTTIPDGTHAVTVTALDAANNSTTSPPTTVRVDNTAPAAPGLSVSGAPDMASKTIQGTIPGGQFSPVVSASYVVCDAAGGGCSSAATIPVSGSTFSFPVTVTPGAHIVRVWLTDEAGNSAVTNAASVTTALASDPTVATTAPASPSVPASDSAVSLATHRSPRRKITVTVLARAPGPIDVTVSITDRHGHRQRRIVRAVHLKAGRGSLVFHTTSASRHVSIRATYAGSAAWLPGSAARVLAVH